MTNIIHRSCNILLLLKTIASRTLYNILLNIAVYILLYDHRVSIINATIFVRQYNGLHHNCNGLLDIIILNILYLQRGAVNSTISCPYSKIPIQCTQIR